jgi:UDP-N-acetylmuramoylalanine--D-glutamate ligase
MTTTHANKLTVVVGLGKTGLACARHLRARGVEVAITDSRAQPPELERARRELPDVRLALGGFDAALLAEASEVVVSPGVSLREPALAAAQARGVPFVSEIELFARAASAPVVAITGSNGKSTVTTLAGLMAERAGHDVAVGGNLGTPALELLRQPEAELYVLELSSFQLEKTESLRPAAAVVLNISADHMDRYDSLADYAAAKQRIYRQAEVCIVNADDPAVPAMVDGDAVRFSVQGVEPQGWGVAQRGGEEWILRGHEPVLRASELRIPGRHNLANALAALALGEATGLPREAMIAALREFTGLAHRTQWIGEAAGITWYDDSKGTNVGATLAAVAGMSQPVILIAGGEGKGQDFAPLGPALAERARALVLIGRDAPLIEAAVAGVVPTVRATSMDEAVQRARELARAGDVVLLSPACASFDMFQGYTHRGEVFRQAVQRWAL